VAATGGVFAREIFVALSNIGMVPSTPHSGLILHTSNRLERLADRLAELIADPLRSPLLPEIVIVQSDGMRRWL